MERNTTLPAIVAVITSIQRTLAITHGENNSVGLMTRSLQFPLFQPASERIVVGLGVCALLVTQNKIGSAGGFRGWIPGRGMARTLLRFTFAPLAETVLSA